MKRPEKKVMGRGLLGVFCCFRFFCLFETDDE